MTERKLTHRDLEPELRRVAITWRVFDRLVAENRGEEITPEPALLSLNLERLAEFLKSLPDGAGETAFLEAWKTRIAAPWIAKAKRAEELARRRARDEQAGA
jgi:hypothetical protein